MAHVINTAKGRQALAVRREPYWNRLGDGLSIGWRKLAAERPGTWLARSVQDSVEQRQSLAVAEASSEDVYAQAVRGALAWRAELGTLAPAAAAAAALTIEQACANYVLAVGDRKRETCGAAAAEVAMYRLRQRHALLVLDRPAFAKAAIRDLTAQDFKAWRRHVSTKPTASRSNRGNARGLATINRDMTVLRAALNQAHHDRLVSNKHAWQEALEPIAHADTGRSRKHYLSPEQRARLAAAAPTPQCAALIAAIAQLPFRPGVVAACNVGDYDPARRLVHLGPDKGHPPRTVELPAEQARLFAQQCEDKLPGAPLFTRASGERWTAETWKGPVKEAVLSAGLPRGSVMYTLRHSVITDLLQAGVDVASVANYAGTSILMIQRNYHHLLAGQSARELAVLKLPKLPARAAG